MVCPDSLSDTWDDQGCPVFQLQGPSLAKSTKSKRELTGPGLQKFRLVNFIWKYDGPSSEVVLLLYLLIGGGVGERWLELVKCRYQ